MASLSMSSVPFNLSKLKSLTKKKKQRKSVSVNQQEEQRRQEIRSKANEERLILRKENMLKQLIDKEIECNQKLKEKYDKNNSLIKQIEDSKLELNVLNGIDNKGFGNKSTENKPLLTKRRTNFFQNKSIAASFASKYMRIGDISKEISLKTIHIFQLKHELECGTQGIAEEEKRLERIREKIELTKHELVLFYHKELLDCKNCRNNGVYLTIIKIWKLGGEIIPSFLPNILDDKCIEFLFKISKILLLKEKNEQNLKVAYSDMITKSNIAKDIARNEENQENTKTEEKIKNIRQEIDARLDKLIRNTVNKYTDVNDVLESCKCFGINESEKKSLDLINKYKTQIKNCTTQIEQLKGEEIARLSHEFLCKGYSKRYNNTTLKDVLKILMGEEVANTEQSRLEVKRRNIGQEIQKIRYFSFIKGI